MCIRLCFSIFFIQFVLIFGSLRLARAEVIGGRYQLEDSTLGEGGFGSAWGAQRCATRCWGGGEHLRPEKSDGKVSK